MFEVFRILSLLRRISIENLEIEYDFLEKFNRTSMGENSDIEILELGNIQGEISYLTRNYKINPIYDPDIFMIYPEHSEGYIDIRSYKEIIINISDYTDEELLLIFGRKFTTVELFPMQKIKIEKYYLELKSIIEGE